MNPLKIALSLMSLLCLVPFSSSSLAQEAEEKTEVVSKYYRNAPEANGEYFDTQTMQWFDRNGRPCTYCNTDAGYGVPVEQIGQGPSQSRYAFSDGYFFSPYALAWFDRQGECLRCEPNTGFWIPDEFAESAEYRKERRRFAQILNGPFAPLPDGRPASAPRAGVGFGSPGGPGFGQVQLPIRFDPRQLTWVDQNGQPCNICTPENGFWIPPQFSGEAEYRAQQQRYGHLVGTLRREIPPPAYPNDFVCGSTDGRYQLCRVDIGRGSVRLIRQLSRSACTQNQTWGFTREGVWVDRGCRARFEIIR